MAEETHVHTEGSSGQNGYGFLLGVVVLILFVVFLLYYLLPMLKQASFSPQINIPGKIDVNVEQAPQGE